MTDLNSPLPNVLVRHAEVADVDGVRTAGRAAGERFRAIDDPRVARHADDEPVATEDLLAWIAGGRCWVASASEDAAGVVGFVVVDVIAGNAHIDEIAVTPAFGGRGIGSALLSTVDRWAIDKGLPAVTLTTFADVPFNRPWYEQHGYRVLAEDELTPALRGRRAAEQEAGLDPSIRVCMRRDL